MLVKMKYVLSFVLVLGFLNSQSQLLNPNRISKDSVLNPSLIKLKFIELNNSHEGLQKPTIDLRFDFYIKAYPVSNHYTDGRYLFDVEGPYRAPYSVQNQYIIQFRRKDD